MSLGVELKLKDGATPALRQLLGRIGSTGRTRLNQRIGSALQQKIRAYLIVLAGTRHTWATKLGAAPTGFLGLAAEAVMQPDVLSVDADGATLAVYSPGMGRAFHHVTIRPGEGKQYITIPIAAESYGKRIRQGDSPRFPGGFFFTSKKGNLLYGLRDGEGVRALYLLKKEVFQPQDRSLLPSDQELLQTACNALADSLQEALTEVNQQIALKE